MDNKRRFLGIIYAGRDITERKRTEEELSRHRNHLEELVKERTVELKFLNENLEREIVERKMVESALMENEGKLNAIFQSINDHMIMLDKDLNIIWANETTKKVYGNDITDMKCYEVFHQRNRLCEPYPCITLNAFKDGKMHTQETRVVTKDGKEHFFQCTANVALRNSEGQTEAVLEIFRDITEIMKKSEELRHSQEILKDKAHDLEEANVALNVLLKRMDEEKQNLEKNILASIKTLITPYLEKLERILSEPGEKALVEELRINFAQIIKPFARRLTEISASLSPTEVQIAELTREGKTAKEISEILNISEYTVKAHKRHIRDKLGIRSKKVNLQSYLQSYFKE